MKPLSTLQNLIYLLGGLLLLAGAVMPIIPGAAEVAPYVFTAGASMFASMQMMAAYEGNDLAVRRLRGQQILGAILLLVAAGMLMMRTFGYGPFQGDEWKIALTIAAVLETYTAFRLPAALKKAGKQ